MLLLRIIAIIAVYERRFEQPMSKQPGLRLT